jgi:hypothetical protein
MSLRRSDMEKKIQLVYVGNDHFQTIKRLPDDSPSGSDYWHCYIPRVIYRVLGLSPQEHEGYILTLERNELAPQEGR